MRKRKHGQKPLQAKRAKRLPAERSIEKERLLEKDESLLKEIKRLQKRLYKEYEIEEIEDDD